MHQPELIFETQEQFDPLFLCKGYSLTVGEFYYNVPYWNPVIYIPTNKLDHTSPLSREYMYNCTFIHIGEVQN